MPQIKSAKKRLRQNIVRQKRNRARRSAVKTEMHKFLDLVTKGEEAPARQELRSVYSQLDRAAAKGVVKKNYVSRQKSRLTRKVNALAAQK